MHRQGFRRSAIRVYDRALGPHQVPRTARAAFRSLRPGTLAVDCGANVGAVTALLAARGADVVAYEPNPFAYAVLAETFAGNPHVRCLPKAVAATAGTALLHSHREAAADQLRWSTGSSLVAGKPNVDPAQAVTVETVDLETELAALGRRVNVLKLDVEGTEVEILERLLATGRLLEIDHVLVELHDLPGLSTRVAALRERLSAPEYRHVRLDWT